MDAQKLVKCLQDLYQEGYTNGIGYANDLEFGCGKSEKNHIKNQEIATQYSFREIMDVLENYLNELIDHIDSPCIGSYNVGLQMAYRSLITQWQIWKEMELKE